MRTFSTDPTRLGQLFRASGSLARCEVMKKYFNSCFGSNPWDDEKQHGIYDSPLPKGQSGSTNYLTSKSTISTSVFSGSNPDSEIAATLAHELSHQASLSTWDGLTYIGGASPTGRCTSDAFERLARCIITKGCENCSPKTCAEPGVVFGPEYYR